MHSATSSVLLIVPNYDVQFEWRLKERNKQKTICNLLQPSAATSQSELISPCSQLGVSGTCNMWSIWSDTIHDRILQKSNILYNNLYHKSVLVEHKHCNSMQCSNSWLRYGLVAMVHRSYKTLGLSFVTFLLGFLQKKKWTYTFHL
jgi:hypothetical protein